MSTNTRLSGGASIKRKTDLARTETRHQYADS